MGDHQGVSWVSERSRLMRLVNSRICPFMWRIDTLGPLGGIVTLTLQVRDGITRSQLHGTSKHCSSVTRLKLGMEIPVIGPWTNLVSCDKGNSCVNV